MAALLQNVGRGKIDGDPLRRQRQAEGDERGAHPLARFGHRFVRQADDGERRQAAGDCHLGLDLDDLDAVKRDRPDPCDHAISTCDRRASVGARAMRYQHRRGTPGDIAGRGDRGAG